MAWRSVLVKFSCSLFLVSTLCVLYVLYVLPWYLQVSHHSHNSTGGVPLYTYPTWLSSEPFLSRGIFAKIRNLRKNSCNVRTNSKKLRSSCRPITFANWTSGFAEVMGRYGPNDLRKITPSTDSFFHEIFSASFARARFEQHSYNVQSLKSRRAVPPRGLVSLGHTS